MDAVEEYAFQAGCVRLEITSGVQRKEAHEFYRKLGFVERSKRFMKDFREPN
jgi:GNAT superfamily N-acetyltransferase